MGRNKLYNYKLIEMKKAFLIIIYFLYANSYVEVSSGQTASRILAALIPKIDSIPRNLVMVDSVNSGAFRTIHIKNVPIVQDQVIGLADSLDNLQTQISSISPVNADWNSPSGLSEILNKPNIPINTNQLINGSGFISGIDNSMVISALGYTPLQTEVDGDITNEIELPTQTGNNGRFLVTNGANASWGKRVEIYSGSTNASGNYSVTFGSTYSATPTITANIIGGSNTNILKITSVSTTGFSVQVVNRVDVVGLLPSFPVVNGASVNVSIIEN